MLVLRGLVALERLQLEQAAADLQKRRPRLTCCNSITEGKGKRAELRRSVRDSVYEFVVLTPVKLC